MVKIANSKSKFTKNLEILNPEKSIDYYQYKIQGEQLIKYGSSQTFTSSRNISDFIRPHFDDIVMVQERFMMMALSQSNCIKGVALISQGGINATVVDIRIIMKYALSLIAPCIVLVHNHPGGMLKPSDADLHMTTRVKEGCKIFDIKLLDHIILTPNDYYSFADQGIL